MATEQELCDFLKSVEKRAFKHSIYRVRNEETALDIVQDSMLKLAQHYGDKPAGQLPMLFQRILANTTQDCLRQRKMSSAIFCSMSELASPAESGHFELLESLVSLDHCEGTQSAQDASERDQLRREIERQVQALPDRQRDAFLLRYCEDMDVAQTAAAMGCSTGSVKTHCSRAVQALSQALSAKGIKP